MASYKTNKGFAVQTLSTDTVASQIDTGAWASAASMNTARIASTGTGSASSNYIIAGGYYLPPTVDRSATEQYNGTAWTEVADCPQDLTYGNGLGSGTSSLLCSYSQPGPVPGGYGPTTATHKWNGSSWSTVNSMNTFRQNAGTAGSTTAGLVFGGTAPGANANTESWDGTNWTEVADLNTAKSDIGGGCGVQTAALSASGSPVTTEQWDGSSWTEVTEINTPRQNSGKAGLYTSALCISGQNPSTYLANVEAWDGTAWTEVSDVATARGYVGGMSPTGSAGSSDAIIAGGSGSSLSAATEVWTTSSTFTQINLGQVYYNSGSNAFKVTEQPVPGGSWSSGGSLNDGRSSLTGIGIQTAVVAVSGQDSTTSLIASVEEYNGSVWAEVNNTPVTLKYHGAGGILTAGWIAGGLTTYNGTAFNAETFEYDGTNWTDSGNINTNRYTAYGGGPQTAAFIAGGNNTSFAAVGNTELYNGSAWSETTDLNTVRNNAFGNGTQTDGIYAGGSPGNKADTELWNGTTWTEVNNLNTARHSIGVGGGTAPGSSVLIAGGTDGTNNLAVVESWNGTSWTEQANLAATNSSNGLGISSAASAINFGGFAPTPSAFATVTEEWTVPEVNKTITVS
ncbi:hypothetical protein OAH18_01365 [bacterium]|nr:hypothetical protein [bacterium]